MTPNLLSKKKIEIKRHFTIGSSSVLYSVRLHKIRTIKMKNKLKRISGIAEIDHQKMEMEQVKHILAEPKKRKGRFSSRGSRKNYIRI